MAYTITSSTGVGYTVEDGTINNTFSLKLVGKNVTNYGQVFAENSLRHLENFASPLAPTPNTTLVGQLWYDTNEKVLRIYKDSTAKWVRTTPVVQSTAPADGVSAGAMYFDTTDDKLKIHDGVSYKDSSYAGEVTNEYSNFGNLNTPSAYGTKLRNIYLKDSGDVPRAVSALVYVNDGEASTTRPGGETVMAIFSDHSTFTAKDTAGSSHGDTYNWYDQLAESDGIGIEINPGMNLRQEYANTSIALADRAYRADGLTGNIVIGASNVAITSLVTSASDIIPDAGDTYDLGSSTNRWQNIYVNGILSLGQTGGTAEVRATSANVTTRVGTTAIFTGNGSFGSITNSGATTLNGSVILGDATADKITLNGQINSHLIPDTTVQYNLGSSTRYWNDLYVNTINAAGNMTFAGQLRLTSTSNPSSVSDTNAPLYLDGGAVIEKKLYVGENITSSANVIGNYFVGTATSAQYADLAEIYSSDADYEPGTVVKLGGSAEVTQTTTFNDPEVFGVVSTNPAYLMNAEAEGVAVALTGRVPVKVEGRIKKGERLVSGSKPGYAKALMKNEYDMRCIIGRALQDKDTFDDDVVEAVIGVK